MFIVWKTTSADPDANCILLDTGAGSSTRDGIYLTFDDRVSQTRNEWLVFNVADSSVGDFEVEINSTDEVARAGEWHVTAVRLASNLVELTSDSDFGFNGSDTPDGSPASGVPDGPLSVGARYDSGGGWFPGDWARVLIISGTVSDADYKAVQDYLTETYDLHHDYYFDAASVLHHDASGRDHNAFGGLCIAPNGDLVAAYRKATDHSLTFDGTIEVKISTDGGTTWGSETTVLSSGSWDYVSASLTTLEDNRIMMAVGRRDNLGVAVTNGITIITSNDNGKSWSSETEVTNSFTDRVREGGPVIELANGDLLYPCYGMDTGDTDRSCRVSRSQDGGATWSALSEMADGETDSLNYTEPGLVLLANGDILCLIRDTTSLVIKICTSDDSGATWGALTAGISGEGRCTPFLLSTGEIIDIQRNANNSELPHLASSLDSGSSWQFGHLFEDSPNFTSVRMVYGQIAQHGDGTLYCLYAVEPTGQALADVMFAKTSIS
jgi:hypothetical protein